MPNPSKSMFFTSLVLTAGIIGGGAMLASQVPVSPGSFVGLSQWGSQSQDHGSDSQGERPSGIANISVMTQAGSTPSSQQALAAPTLELTIEGVQGNEGTLLLFVFADEASYNAFDYFNTVGYAELDASGPALTYTFPDLTAGPYVVSIFHDANGNQDLDMQNGIPIEGYGTSGTDDPYAMPSFAEAAVDAGPATIQMHYLK